MDPNGFMPGNPMPHQLNQNHVHQAPPILPQGAGPLPHGGINSQVNSVPQSQSSMEQAALTPVNNSSSISRTVFVGNIPYDAEDAQIKNILKLVGPYNAFRLKHDKDTEKPKGYGFCEYKDMDIASSALRNLNGYELNGRQLRVDFASDNKNGTNLKDEEVKFRDISDVYNQETGEICTSTTPNLFKNLSIGQKEYILNAIKTVIEKQEGAEQEIEKLLEKDQALCDELLRIQEEVIESYKNPPSHD